MTIRMHCKHGLINLNGQTPIHQKTLDMFWSSSLVLYKIYGRGLLVTVTSEVSHRKHFYMMRCI